MTSVKEDHSDIEKQFSHLQLQSKPIPMEASTDVSKTYTIPDKPKELSFPVRDFLQSHFEFKGAIPLMWFNQAFAIYCKSRNKNPKDCVLTKEMRDSIFKEFHLSADFYLFPSQIMIIGCQLKSPLPS
jgi:hypothetical protein